MRNSHRNARLPDFLTIAGFVFLAVPVYFLAAWISSSSSEPGHFEAVENFRLSLPGFLSLHQAAVMCFILPGLALVAGFSSLLLRQKFHKSTIFLVIISALLSFLNLFQLM